MAITIQFNETENAGWAVELLKYTSLMGLCLEEGRGIWSSQVVDTIIKQSLRSKSESYNNMTTISGNFWDISNVWFWNKITRVAAVTPHVSTVSLSLYGTGISS